MNFEPSTYMLLLGAHVAAVIVVIAAIFLRYRWLRNVAVLAGAGAIWLPLLVVGWMWKAPAALVIRTPLARTAPDAVKLPQGVVVTRVSRLPAPAKLVPSNSGRLSAEAV